MTSMKLTAMALLLAMYNLAAAQGVTVGSDSGAPGGTAVVPLGYVQQNNLRNFQIVIEYDGSVLSPQTTTDATFGELVNGCPVDLSGVNWEPNRTRCIETSTGTIAITVASGDGASAPALDGLDPFGSITFGIDGSATVGTSLPVTVRVTSATQTGSTTSDASLLSTTDGAVTVEITGSAGFASNPAPTSTVGLGSAVVGNVSADSPSNITVSEVGDQQLDVTAFPFTGANPGDFSTTAAPFNIADGGAPVDVPLRCTPSDVGIRTATFEITNNSSNAPNAQYTVECTGLAPNVQVAPTTIALNGAIGGTPPTGSFTIENPQTTENTASDAQNASLTVTTDASEITITDNIDDNVITVGETDTVTFSCSTANFGGPFTETVQIAWDDPVNGGQATQDVTVTCNIDNVAPGYTSVPAVPGPLAFGAVPFGTASTETINIGNQDSVGTGEQAELEVTGAVLSDMTNYNIVPASPAFTLAAGATNGTESIDVTCTPSGVGNVPAATLTVQTNDGDQVYDLACEGTGDSLSSTPGDLNLGTVPPGTATNEGEITFTNNKITGDIVVENCSFTGDTAVIAGNPDEANFGFTLQPGTSEVRAFQCTPPDISSFALDVSCGVTGGDNATLDFTVSCAGRPLVIPTMSRWGLVVMSLVLLLVAGVAGRRMLA